MSWVLQVSNPARKELRRLSGEDRARILDVLDTMRTEPLSGDLQRLKGATSNFRRRVGALRIIFGVDSDERTVTIHRVARRTDTTYR